ncbi:hypothetical protein [Caminibacter pacificus]|uniref:Uncharacterized protein n=1 Tax=Caminibacter pacificus TaxID=1424653 RepID=A0AAJ4RET7_9BACT|nr:hypothetical protein [Caminibacter pacificus]NPA88122.1 hypothetical protein [Campylobacterota bacterium]QCI28104.1 hypothetical protein C6V80_03780 [Caminibacter pacificus]ROR41186.1 hypothetical protein EDC58_0671 [Caminibacter pacificus]
MYNKLIEFDDSANAIILKTDKESINSIVKLNSKEIKELKIKKEAILFYTLNPVINNPLKPECTFLIYTSNNMEIEVIYESEDKEELIKFEEFVKTTLI